MGFDSSYLGNQHDPRRQWPPPAHRMPVQPRTPPVQPPPRRRPYPAHLTRFPWALMPVAPHGRRRSASWLAWRVTHPVTAVITLAIWASGAAFILGWMALVTLMWLAWVTAITAGWAVALPFRPRH
jgi:hypothetical protein